VLQPGVCLSDRGHIILGARVIGAGTMIHDRVTIGMNLFDEGIPVIGNDVWIGPNCIIYGNILVGDGVTILPNTVLAKSVPGCVVLLGNPARIVRRGFDNAVLRSSLATDVEMPPVETGSV
jgi:serine O-acetyltransferase